MAQDNETWPGIADSEVKEMMHGETEDYQDKIRLSKEDQARFAELLLNPPELSPAMIEAKEAHEQLIRESR